MKKTNTENIMDTINAKLEELKVTQHLAEVVLPNIERSLYWAMVEATDEDGNTLYDEKGETVHVPPAEDSYYYTEYKAWSLVIDTVKQMLVDRLK